MNGMIGGTSVQFLMEEIKSLREETAKLKQADQFSLNETCIGVWIDGKPLYRKMIDFGELPSNGRKDFTYDIDNIAHVHINLSASFWYTMNNSIINAGYKASSTFIYNDYIVSISAAAGNRIIIYTNNTDANKYKALVCLEYTKTTD